MISQSRYIKIVSGVGAGAAVAQRQLIMRLITENSLIPPGIVMEFANPTAVGAYFGTSSEEFFRATAYFAFISKQITSPQLISFARWVNAAIAPMIVGDATTKSLTSLAAVSAGTLTINDGATVVAIAALNFTTDLTLSAVAATLQTALRATSDSQLTTCTVTFNTNTNQFVLTGSTTGNGTLTVTPGGANDVSALLGWGTSGAVYVAGQAADTAAVAVQKSAAISTNFGSFAYCTPAVAMVNADIVLIAAWNDSMNNMYMYSVATTLANLAALYALVKGYSGTALNILSTTLANDYVEQSPCEILAATNYANPNATQNFMYYQFAARNVTVSDDTTASTADLSRGNYIGQTQSAGQPLAFYQRGVLCGGSTAATDMNTYANEMWLKATIATNLLSLFLAVGRVPANATGGAMIVSVLQDAVTKAKTNGTISPGKSLSNVQQQYIGQVTGDPQAWHQVGTVGYWMTVTFSTFVTPDGRTEWQANYTLVYSKDDAVRVVQGSDILI